MSPTAGQRSAPLPMPVPGVILALALAAFLAACSRPGPADNARSESSPPSGGAAFRLAPVESRRLERAIEVTGSLLPIDLTPVALKVAGRIERIEVDLGSVVRAGDVLARLELADFDLRVRQAAAALGQARARVGLPLDGDDDRIEVERSSAVTEARAVLDEAAANRDRILALSRQGILSASEFETASAAFKVAQSRLAEALEEARIRVAQLQQRRAEYEIARRQLADAEIRAPFDGAVQERRASIGEYLAVGAPVVVLVRVDPLRLRVEVSERDAHRVQVGLPVRVTVEGDPGAYTGEIRRLSPAIASGSRTLMVEADVPSQGRLRPGSFARARLITRAESEALVIPAEAVVSFAGIEKVFTVADGKSAERRITTGDRGTNWVEVVSGLNPGDIVVLAPGSLQAGQAVSDAGIASSTNTGAGPNIPAPVRRS